MRGLLAALSLLAAAAPASAGFLYLPPAGGADAAGAEEPAPARVAPAGGIGTGADATVPPAGPGPAVWRVNAGETLRAALSRWGARAGADVVFLTDRRYRLDGAAVFEGGFGHAVQALFRRLSHLPHAPVAARSEGGTTLVVTHRPPRPPDGGDER